LGAPVEPEVKRVTHAFSASMGGRLDTPSSCASISVRSLPVTSPSVTIWSKAPDIAASVAGRVFDGKTVSAPLCASANQPTVAQ
jgi:hypothetical protein